MRPPKISIIILNWNKLDYLKQCIENAVKNTDYPNYEIVILDNASTEAGTKEYLSSLPHKTITSPVNLGFAKGNNEAVKHATGGYLLLLNNDTIPKHDWLALMIELMLNNPKCGIVGSKLLYPDGTIQHIGVYLDYKGRRKHYFKRYPPDIPEAMEVRECEAVTGACLLIKKSLFEKVGGFDERYIQGVEDIDLCFKVRDAGYNILFCPQSVLIHFEGTSMKDVKDKQRKKIKKRNDGNNEKIFYEKWGSKLDIMRIEYRYSRFKPYDYYNRDFSKIIKLIPERAISILNIGHGAGFLSNQLKETGIQKEMVMVEDYEANSSNLISQRKFDCIILSDVLEHLKDPWAALKVLREYLLENGVMIAGIPNIRHYSVMKDIVQDRWFYREEGILDGNHLRFFGLSTIKHLFSTSGLDIIDIKRLGKEREEKLMKILNRLSFDAFKEFLTFQYLILAKKKKHILDESSAKL